VSNDDQPTEQLPVVVEAKKAIPEPKKWTPPPLLAKEPKLFRDRRKAK
jgi:hypothetical protein